MSTLHVRHIESALNGTFDGLVDLSDLPDGLGEEDRKRSFLSRALAAYPVVELTSGNAREVALGITDGYDDNGLDLVHYDVSEEKLYLVQSKWDQGGTGGPSVESIQKFVQGVKDLLNSQFDRFNTKLRAMEKLITAALDNPRIRLEMIFAHTGTGDPSEHVTRLLGDLEADLNDSGDLLRVRILNQSDLHAMVAGEAEPDRIDADIALFEWGQITEPFVAYYGQVAVSDVAHLYQEHGPALFSKNLRKFIHGSEVNNLISESLRDAPEHFWYLNNGITVLCQSITRKAIGGTGRTHGEFACEGISVVNGAQTVGSIGRVFAAKGFRPETVDDSKVLIRLISLETGPPEFAGSVTRATNTQNRIVNRDFVALDSEQERLRIELRIDGLTYALQTGDPDPDPEDGCSVTEATVALACAIPDVQYAVQVKREIGRVWEDIESPTYRAVFNDGVSGTRLWRAVQVMRRVDRRINQIQKTSFGRRRLIAVHGNRVLLHAVFQQLPQRSLEEGGPLLDPEQIEVLVNSSLDSMCKKVDSTYAANYPANVFKNTARCRAIAKAILDDAARPALFTDGV